MVDVPFGHPWPSRHPVGPEYHARPGCADPAWPLCIEGVPGICWPPQGIGEVEVTGVNLTLRVPFRAVAAMGRDAYPLEPWR